MTVHEEAPETRRLTANEILEAVIENARAELKRSARGLAFSGLAGGLTMGITGLAVASVRALLGPGAWQTFASYMFYPIGFIAVIIGRAQLFTENTLYPVIVVLDEHRYLVKTLRLWGIVYGSNILGAFLFALLVIRSNALLPEISTQLVQMGISALDGTGSHFFWSGIIGGWIIALVAWVVTASHWTIGQLVMVWLLTFVVGAGKFAHCIVTSGEVLAAVMAGAVSGGAYFHWLALATLGNIVGGTVIVSLLNYGQVRTK